MSPYVLHGGMIGFLLVLVLNLVNGNSTGQALMNSCIAALAFGLVANWFARSLFTELHHSLWQAQQGRLQADTPAKSEPEPEPDASEETPDA